MMRRFLAVGCLALLWVGCSGPSPEGFPSDIGGGFGATPGGAQDMALARRKIAEGQVPHPDDFLAEGLFSEHDLPLEGPPCEQVLCLRTATGIATALDTDRQEVFVQVGFSSNVDPATFRRKPLDVALVIDRSGSMMGEPMTAVKEAARRLVGKLDERDTFSLITFDDVAETLVPQTALSDRAALLRAIDTLEVRGSTCIECGLQKGYAQLSSRPPDAARARRLFLFTDAMPNVGPTGEGEFMRLVREQSQRGQDLTVFGVNIAFNQEFVAQISSVRGANSFYLSDAERTRSVFDQDFDYLVTPIAYDLKMELTPAEGYRIEAVYGLPGVKPGDARAGMTVSSVFLSRNRGAVLARLSRVGEAVPPGQSLAASALSFQSTAGEPSATLLTARYEGSEPLTAEASWYSQEPVRKTVALTNFILGAQVACEKWHGGDKVGAHALAERTAQSLAKAAEQLDDAPLRAEAELARKLTALLKPSET
ncbi:vWA domain-containing protein [Archangium primigenium]|uniref:vWA domain-containing protein n=1 Tax=[Archangium] primigenium TaxID=2792470 RepID=UPI00195B63E0|nr:VWA domain-containing protein [Archangium primigenium]MBM7119107.1 VWA domain-containing protein [Archangium primigenium]